MQTFAAGNRNVLPGRKRGLPGGTGTTAGEVPEADIASMSGTGLHGHTVEGHYALLLDGAYLTPAGLLSPGDSRDTPWRSGPVQGTPDNGAHYSYSMLEIDMSGGRRKGWDGGSIGASTPLLADRLIKPSKAGTAKTYKSYWSAAAETWRGSVGYGDTHVDFEDKAKLQDTSFGAVTCDSDDLFANETSNGCDGQSNAVLLQHGKDEPDGIDAP